jgi:hypothetical protein
VADKDVANCMKCNTTFTFTVRKVCYLVCFFFLISFENLFFHSIIVGIVKRFFVIIVQIIGYKIKNQSMFRVDFSKNKIFSFLFSTPKYRVCDDCNEKVPKESPTPMPSDPKRSVSFKSHVTTDEVGLRFDARSENLQPRTDSQ